MAKTVQKSKTSTTLESVYDNISLGVTLGKRPENGKPVFQFNDDRYRHTVILGRTGAGKSNPHIAAEIPIIAHLIRHGQVPSGQTLRGNGGSKAFGADCLCPEHRRNLHRELGGHPDNHIYSPAARRSMIRSAPLRSRITMITVASTTPVTAAVIKGIT